MPVQGDEFAPPGLDAEAPIPTWQELYLNQILPPRAVDMMEVA
jgi:hypothetical protein